MALMHYSEDRRACLEALICDPHYRRHAKLHQLHVTHTQAHTHTPAAGHIKQQPLTLALRQQQDTTSITSSTTQQHHMCTESRQLARDPTAKSASSANAGPSAQPVQHHTPAVSNTAFAQALRRQASNTLLHRRLQPLNCRPRVNLSLRHQLHICPVHSCRPGGAPEAPPGAVVTP